MLWRDEVTVRLMLDRTPELFCFSPNDRNILEKSVNITTVDAVDLLQCIQLAQLVSINSYIFRSLDIWDPIKLETDPMVDLSTYIKEKYRKDHPIYERCGNYVLE